MTTSTTAWFEMTAVSERDGRREEVRREGGREGGKEKGRERGRGRRDVSRKKYVDETPKNTP